MAQPVDTPCIGICSTIYGDELCRGCQRTYLEIIDWNRYTAAEKKVVFERLEAQISAVVAPVLSITDVSLLQQQLDKLHIRYRPEGAPLAWAFALLRAGQAKIQDISKYGIAIQTPYDALSLSELFTQLEQALQRCSHESYFLSLQMDKPSSD